MTGSPTVEELRNWKAGHPDPTKSCVMEFAVAATLPAETKNVAVRFPKVMSDTVVIVNRPNVPVNTLLLRPGELSAAIDVRPVPPGEVSQRDDSSNVLKVAWRFCALGFEHIIPKGLDHCLFVLGIFLLNPRIKPVLWQITAFTVAHTITLTLTSLGVIGLPSTVVEPAIAASIAFVAVENLFTDKVHSWRYAVAFVFGLVHGMGIATFFNESGFSKDQIVTSLAAFTVGVESGHLAVLAAAFLTLAWFRSKPWYGKAIRVPLSIGIACVAVYWVFERLGG